MRRGLYFSVQYVFPCTDGYKSAKVAARSVLWPDRSHCHLPSDRTAVYRSNRPQCLYVPDCVPRQSDRHIHSSSDFVFLPIPLMSVPRAIIRTPSFPAVRRHIRSDGLPLIGTWHHGYGSSEVPSLLSTGVKVCAFPKNRGRHGPDLPDKTHCGGSWQLSPTSRSHGIRTFVLPVGACWQYWISHRHLFSSLSPIVACLPHIPLRITYNGATFPSPGCQSITGTAVQTAGRRQTCHHIRKGARHIPFHLSARYQHIAWVAG